PLVLAVFDQSRHNLVEDVDRDGEANTAIAVAAIPGFDLRIHAYHVAGQVEQRAARVARVDGRVGLDRLRDGELRQRRNVAAKPADNAFGQRAIEAERIANRHDGLTDGDVAHTAKCQRSNIGRQRIDLYHRQIAV